MKKLGIILASVAGALVIILAVLLLFFQGKKVESGDDESLYPYSYTQSKKSVVLRITGDFPKGYTWAAREGERVSIEKTKEKRKETQFTIRPIDTGNERLLFTLQKEQESGLSDRIYEIYVDVYALEGEIEIISNYHQELEGTLDGTQEGFSYRIAPQEDGTLILELQQTERADWTPARVGTSATLDFEEIRQADGYCRIRLTGLDIGQTTMRFCDAQHGMALECYLSADAFHNLTVVEHKIVPYSEEGGKE